MPDEMAQEIHRAVMTTCIPESVLLARDLRIPPPIPLPQINVKGQEKGAPKKDQFGFEVT